MKTPHWTVKTPHWTVEPVYYPEKGGRKYVKGCPFCERMRDNKEDFFPPHKASVKCQSGGHPHCTCRTCF